MEWRNPKPTVDVIIQVDERIVLIRRRNPPLGWALPGGFVDEGEKVENAAIREAKEETEMDVVLDELLYVYSDPARDRRFHTLSIVFTAHAQGLRSGPMMPLKPSYFHSMNYQMIWYSIMDKSCLIMCISSAPGSGQRLNHSSPLKLRQ